jgi:hypothetical protein
MRYIRTTYDRAEERRDRRYPLPPLAVKIDGAEYTTLNWSLGGFLLGNWTTPTKPAEVLNGTLQAEKDGPSFGFTVEVVRWSAEAASLAAKFVEIEPGAMDHLDRSLARRFARRR